MSNSNERNKNIMNQTMSTNFELKRPLSHQMNHEFKNSQNQFISNIQSLNLEQNNQNIQSNQQSFKNDQRERNLTNQKATSSMISSEQFTHFKKQKIQNLINESSYYEQPSNRIDIKKFNFTSGETKCSNLNILNQINQTTSNQLNDQLNNQFNKQHINYPESSLSPSSTGSNESSEPQTIDHPVDLKIKNSVQLADTSCSSNEYKEDNQSQFNGNELMQKINLANQMSLFHRSNNSLQNSVLDNIELKIMKEPARYHRARYMTEGKFGF